ncbi:hypothetical protein M885DRAFT_524477 [Pelagophyceae sp. CCMP2097]|nr:hypothetical protein M885DRAFT_524477 [Pelagophyceae sp. CCMP2097]
MCVQVIGRNIWKSRWPRDAHCARRLVQGTRHGPWTDPAPQDLPIASLSAQSTFYFV